MKVAVTQPNYIPWIGYFDLLDEVDLFVAFDNAQFVKRSFIVRNRVKSPNGEPVWLTVNLHSNKRGDKINEVFLNDSDWSKKHIQKIEMYYRNAPFYDEYIEVISKLLKPLETESTLSEYNIRLLNEFSKLLSIETKIVKASDFMKHIEGSAEDKILKICKEVGASSYYNFKKGVEEGLYDPGHFTEQDVKLFKQDYVHPTYEQINGEYIPYLSIVDLLFNQGDKTFDIIKSGSNWVKLN